MTSRSLLVLMLVLALAGIAQAAESVEPAPGRSLSGTIAFPRPQAMSIRTSRTDGSLLQVRMGFDGRCRGGVLKEAWASQIATSPTVRVRDGRLEATLRGTSRTLGGVRGRTGRFTWRLRGRFTARDTVRATVTGTAVIREGGKLVARCAIAEATPVRLTVR